MATNPNLDREASESREGLRRALSECHEQLQRTERALRKSREQALHGSGQDNAPSDDAGSEPA